MKFFAIGLVIVVLAGAFYVTDRKTTVSKSLHLADSLDEVTRGSIDSFARATNLNYNAKIYQLNKHIRFQDGVIIRLQDQVDRLELRIRYLDSASHVHSEVIKNPFGQKLTR